MTYQVSKLVLKTSIKRSDRPTPKIFVSIMTQTLTDKSSAILLSDTEQVLQISGYRLVLYQFTIRNSQFAIRN